MDLLSGDVETQIAFSIHENKGVFALLLGSGLSRAADIPTGWEITLDLIRRVAATKGVLGPVAWDKWYLEQTGQDPNYSTLVESLGLSRDERRSILHGYIEPTKEDLGQGRKVPTKAHRAIAALVGGGHVRVIVTTNFDRLIESALRDEGIEPTVIASPDALAGAEPMVHSACYLLKLHGDYKDARILNTEAELKSYPTEYDKLLDQIFDEYGLIIAGWSAQWDHALRVALTRVPSRRYSTYWTTRSELNSSGSDLAHHRRARVVQIKDADSFFGILQERVATLEQSRRQSPESIALLVNSAKRYLAKPEHRIQLEDLVTEQTEALLQRTDVPELKNVSEGPDEGGFSRRISRLESAAEPLVRLLGALGRWGSGTEMHFVCDSIRALYIRPTVNPGGGLTIWLDTRNYPSVLAFTGYGLALARAQRWEALHHLLNATIQTPEKQEAPRFAEALLLWIWPGGKDHYWKRYTGLQNRYTPLSDHLCELFSSWSADFFGLVSDFESEFERFELLAALGYLEGIGEKQLEELLSQQNNTNFTFMPVGRVMWHYGRRLELQIRSTEMRRALLKAGFAHGSEKFFDLFFENYDRMRRRINWI